MTTLRTALQEDMDIKGERAEFHLLSPEVVSLNDDGVTWSKIPNMVANLPVGFSSHLGTLTKTGNSGIFLYNGTSDLQVSKACTIFYGRAINGVIAPYNITSHTFTATAKIENISVTALMPVTAGETLEIWCKGDGTLGVLLTVEKLDLTFWG